MDSGRGGPFFLTGKREIAYHHLFPGITKHLQGEKKKGSITMSSPGGQRKRGLTSLFTLHVKEGGGRNQTPPQNHQTGDWEKKKERNAASKQAAYEKDMSLLQEGGKRKKNPNPCCRCDRCERPIWRKRLPRTSRAVEGEGVAVRGKSRGKGAVLG